MSPPPDGQDHIQLAGCIIRDEQGRLLLIHRSTPQRTHWEIPGGKVDPGEAPEAAAVRELREELGVTVKITRKLGEKTFPHGDRTMNYHWFEATITDGQPHILEPHTHDRFAYFSISELRDTRERLSANTANFLQEVSHPR